MTRRISLWLTILALALFGGPGHVDASGEWTVICGADGEARLVFFDFEKGAPAAPEAVEDCERCILLSAALIAGGVAAPQPPKPARGVAQAGDPLRPAPQPGRLARAPPVLI